MSLSVLCGLKKLQLSLRIKNTCGNVFRKILFLVVESNISPNKGGREGRKGGWLEMRATCTAGPRRDLSKSEERNRECFLLVTSCTSCRTLSHGHLLTYRRLLHRHPVVPLEGVCHHSGQLPAPLRPQVPAETVLPAQLLEAHLISCRELESVLSGEGIQVPCA